MRNVPRSSLLGFDPPKLMIVSYAHCDDVSFCHDAAAGKFYGRSLHTTLARVSVTAARVCTHCRRIMQLIAVEHTAPLATHRTVDMTFSNCA